MTANFKGGMIQLVCVLYDKDLHSHNVSLLMLLSPSLKMQYPSGFADFNVNMVLSYVIDKARRIDVV